MVAHTLKLVSGVSLTLSVLALGTGCGGGDSNQFNGAATRGDAAAGGSAGTHAGTGGMSGGGMSGGGTAGTGMGGGASGSGAAPGTGGASGGDAGGGCTTGADCIGTADCIGGVCKPFTTCKNSLDCSTNQVCNGATHRCAECAVKADCGTTQECVAGSCVTVTPCTSDKQCTPLRQLCDAPLGRCADCLTTADCPTGTACVGGACVAGLCTPNTKFCDGNAVATCDATGQVTTLPKACTSSQYCDPQAVACATQVCAPRGVACKGTVLTTCNATGSGYVAGGTDCAATNQTCVNGACKTCNGGATASASVRLAEVMIGTPEYVVLENTSACQVNLNGLTLSFGTSNPSGTSSTFALPPQALAPGEKVFVVDGTTASPSPAPTDIAATNIDWQASYGGIVMLCNGACTGTTVLDALSYQGGAAPPTLPSPVTFAPSLTTLTTTNEQTDAFHRTAFTGVSPAFKPSDWSAAAASRPGTAGTTTTCPLTQPANSSSCLAFFVGGIASCPYGTVTCTCSYASLTWSCL